MSLVDNGGLSAADIAAVTGNNNGGFGFGGDGAWWLIVLFLFAFAGNGWGGGFGNAGGGMMMPWMMGNNDTQRGFDQAAIMGGINGITAALANAEVSRCNSQSNILQAIYNGQTNTTAGINNLAMGLQQCCCDNRAAVADLKYTVASEACSDRAAIESALRDILVAQNAGIQSIKDQLCQDKIAAKDDLIAQLRSELMYSRGQSSQDVQTATIQAGQRNLANEIEQYVLPTPRPAYIVQNPSCCNQFYNGGCGYAA